MYKRVHPVYMVESIWRQLYLLLIPLVRGMLHIYSMDGFYQWLRGAWLDLLVLLFILCVSFLSWRFQRYRVDESGVVVRKGFLIRREISIPLSSVSTLMIYEPFFLRPLHAVHLFVDTDAGSVRRADCQVTISRRDAMELAENGGVLRLEKESRLYRPKWYEVAFLSVFVSSTFTGVVFLATFFGKGGDILGDDFRMQLLNRLEGVAHLVYFIPEAAVMVALLLLVAWGIGFIHNFLSYVNFAAYRQKGYIRLRYGWPSRRWYTCRTEAVNFVDYRQSILSKLLRVYMVFIQCAGYAKSSGEHAVLIPAGDQRSVRNTMETLLPEFQRRKRQIKPPSGSVIRYAMLPFWCGVAVAAGAVVAAWLLPEWKSLILFFGIMLALPFVWLLLVRLIDCYTAGIGASEEHLTLYYTVFYAFHTVVVPKEKINNIYIRSSLLQKWSGNCDVIIYTYSEMGRRHRVENLKISEVEALLEKSGLLSKSGEREKL